eukprot:scaffold10028_cov236-Isochrysis_galbana.AAC.3
MVDLSHGWPQLGQGMLPAMMDSAHWAWTTWPHTAARQLCPLTVSPQKEHRMGCWRRRAQMLFHSDAYIHSSGIKK